MYQEHMVKLLNIFIKITFIYLKCNPAIYQTQAKKYTAWY